jgi:hypothetical protein
MFLACFVFPIYNKALLTHLTSKLQIYGHYHWDRRPRSHQMAKVRMALPQGRSNLNPVKMLTKWLCCFMFTGRDVMPKILLGWYSKGIDDTVPGIERGYISCFTVLEKRSGYSDLWMCCSTFWDRLDGMSLVQVKDNSGCQFGILNLWPHRSFCAPLRLL